MKKRMSRMISVLMTLALVFSAADVVCAQDAAGSSDKDLQFVGEASQLESEEVVDTASAIDAQAEEIASEQELEPLEIPNNAAWKKNAVVNIPVNIWSTKADTEQKPTDGYVGYTTSDRVGDYYGYSQPVKLKKGTLFLMAEYGSGSGIVWFGLFKDKDLSQAVETPLSLSGPNSSNNKLFNVQESGQYYIGVYSTSVADQNIVGLRVINYDGTDRTVKNNQIIVAGQKDAKLTQWYKFKAVNTGSLKVEVDDSAVYHKVTLCSSKKKALSKSISIGYNPVYGVKKGQTYYIKVTTDVNGDGFYAFRVVNKAVKGIALTKGTTKAKAVTLKSGKAQKGTIVAGEAAKTQADWYKFKLTKNKKVKITFTGYTDDLLKITVYKGSKKVNGGTMKYARNKNGIAGGLESKYGKMSKGTYYIKVERGNTKSSGYYSIKWK